MGNAIAPGVGTVAGTTLMGASAAGNAYQEALNNGMDKSQARTYSTLVGASEALLSATLSKVMGGKVLSGKVQAAIDGIENGFWRFAANYGTAFVSEGMEEGLQEILTPFFENFALGYNKNGFEDIDWGEVTYSFLLGGLSGGLFETIGAVGGKVINHFENVSRTAKTYDTGDKVLNLIDFGLKMPKESKAYKLAEKYNAESLKKGKLSTNKVYNLSIASENVIADRLMQLGETKNISAVASAVVKKLSGIELSLSETELLTKSSYGQEVLETVVPKSENSSVVKTGSDTTLTDEETQLLNTPDAELTVEQRAEKQSIIEKQQAANTPPSTAVGAEGDTTVDNATNNEYNNTRGEEYARTDEFRGLHAESQGMSDEDIQLYHAGGKQLDGKIRENIARIFRSQINAARNGVRNDNGLLKLESKGNSFNLYENVDGKLFHDIFEMARKYLRNGELVDLHTVETTEDGVGYNDCYNYLSEDGLSGFSITPDGDLISVFNASGKAGFLGAIAPIVKERAKTLDCYNSPNQPLRAMYEKVFGFKTASIMDYNMDFDHDNIAENHGNPKIAFMVNTEAEVETKEFSKDEYDQAVSYRDSFVEKADPAGPANFMPEGENGDGESGDNSFGLSDPSDQEIYRDPTDEENAEAIFGKRKNAKQRHILDVAKKLDSGMKVVFVDENARVLSGQKGVYMRESNTIYLSESNSVVDSYYQVFKHEFIHRLESKGAYQSFKNYLFRHSSAFESYARAQLGENFKGTREEALQALAQKYIDTVQNGTFSQDFKKSFTEEDAQREMVADFISEVLFKGNRADVAQNLADGNLEAIYKVEDTLTEFENLTETDRNWFQKIVDWVRDLIASLKGVKQNERLVKDLEYIEKRLGRVYDSWDTKKAASRAGDVQFSIVNLDNGKSYVQASRKVISGNSVAKWRSQISNFFNKALKNGPIEIKTIEGDILTISKETAKKARDKHISENGVSRELKDEEFLVKLHAESHIDELAEISISKKDVNNNKKIVPDKKNHAIAKDGFSYRTVYFQDFNGSYYRITLSVGENNGVSTVYNVGKMKAEDIPNGNIVSAIGSKADMSSANSSVTQNSPTVNSNSTQKTEDYSEPTPKGKRSFSLGSPVQQMRDNHKKYESGEITQEEYQEETDNLWGKANETYGIIPEGENANAPIATPTAVADDKPTERFTRTIIETGKLTDEMLEGMEEKALLGGFSYEVISDEKSIKKADTAIKNGTAEDIWQDAVNGKKVKIPENFVPCWEMWLRRREETTRIFEREKARGWGRKENPKPKRRAIIVRDYQKVFIEDYHE